MKIAIEILTDYIKYHERDGLCFPEGPCGCILDDLIPCDGCQPGCVPAFDIGGSPDGDDHYMLIRQTRPTQEEIKQYWDKERGLE